DRIAELARLTDPNRPPDAPGPVRVVPAGYLAATRTATYGFLAALPLLVLYEVGILLANGGQMPQVRLGGVVWPEAPLPFLGRAAAATAHPRAVLRADRGREPRLRRRPRVRRGRRGGAAGRRVGGAGERASAGGAAAAHAPARPLHRGGAVRGAGVPRAPRGRAVPAGAAVLPGAVAGVPRGGARRRVPVQPRPLRRRLRRPVHAAVVHVP